MVLANRAKLQNSRSLVRVFGGLNETYACSEAEYSAGVNFSAVLQAALKNELHITEK